MKDRYVEIHGDGRLDIVAPDASLGITYVVNATVDGSIGEYLPADTPKAGLFSQFLETSLPSPAVRGLVQEFAGYSLLNSTAFQVGQLWVGEGRNGKSVGLEIVSALHAKPVAMRLDNLTGFALQPLIGASLAVVSEAQLPSLVP
jgi:putative DNA primase/helicase